MKKLKENNKNIRIKLGAWCVVLLFCVVSFSDCAQQTTPKGGPKDSLPPVVVGAVPEYKTTNFKGERIQILFDEYVQLKDQQKHFFMSPFPAKKPTLMIKNRSVVVDLKAPLDSGVTYTLNFGAALADNNEGNVLHGLTYVFSTGNEIDSMTLTGLALDAYTLDSLDLVYVAFFDPKADSLEKDSTLYRSRALSVGRTNEYGIFIRNFLKPMDYKVYAFLDNNGNQMYERGIDLVAFSDELYNPATQPEVSFWEDTAGVQLADAQLEFYLFKEKPLTRQNFYEMKRPMKNMITLKFNAPWPQIDTLEIEGVDKSKMIFEYLKPERDSIAVWLDMPLDKLSDTLKGRLVYQKPDTLNVMRPAVEPILLSFFEKKAEDKEVEEENKKPLTVNVKVKGNVLPYENLPLEFVYPLKSVDKSKILLEYNVRGDIWQKVALKFERDSVNIRQWVLSAPWVKRGSYRLTIPAGVFKNIAGEQNDTLKAPFTIANHEDFSTLRLNITGADTLKNYIVQLVDPTSKGLKVQREIKSVGNGQLTIEYVEVGNCAIRIIEDVNRNEKWDVGDLERRVAPERVRLVKNQDGSSVILCKKNWEIDIDVDIEKVFARRKVVKTEIVIDSLAQPVEHNHQHGEEHNHEEHQH